MIIFIFILIISTSYRKKEFNDKKVIFPIKNNVLLQLYNIGG